MYETFKTNESYTGTNRTNRANDVEWLAPKSKKLLNSRDEDMDVAHTIFMSAYTQYPTGWLTTPTILYDYYSRTFEDRQLRGKNVDGVVQGEAQSLRS